MNSSITTRAPAAPKRPPSIRSISASASARSGLIATPFAGKKDEQRRRRLAEGSPYADRLDRPEHPDLAGFISTPEEVSEFLLRMIEAPEARFRWVCGRDSENWLAARRALDDAAFEDYVTGEGYGAPLPGAPGKRR